MKKFNNGLKKVLILYGVILLILIGTCVIVYMIYSNKIKEAERQSLITAQKMSELVLNNNILEEASSEISKTINEVIEDDTNKIVENEEETSMQTTNDEATITYEEPIVEEVKIVPLEFGYPVEGEMVKEFSIDNLIFSETLQEWIVHKGIDLKAARTTIVKSAEEGTVQSIKNDPRYGLTVIIEHRDGFKTIYSNLLTTEFITEGENVSKGQSIGTVGNSAAFEIADEPHLHFEMTKDGETIDPTLHLK